MPLGFNSLAFLRTLNATPSLGVLLFEMEQLLFHILPEVIEQLIDLKIVCIQGY